MNQYHTDSAHPEQSTISTASDAVVSSAQQIESLARAHAGDLLNEPIPSRDALIQAANELAQLANYLAQTNIARSQFLSKVSHELRTPLTVAKGWIAMLRYGELLPEQERTVQVVDQQIDELTWLVNDLLDLSRRETGMLSLNLEMIDLVTLVERVAEHQRELTSLQGIQLTVYSQVDQIYSRVDRGRIAQVLNNMITNACRYVPHYSDGRIDLHVIASETTVQLSVSDNGVGIEPDHLPRIFEPFYQVERGQRGKSGLGLAIAKELVQAHGGSLTVESIPGKGTTFHIWLRRVDPESTHVNDGSETGT